MLQCQKPPHRRKVRAQHIHRTGGKYHQLRGGTSLSHPIPMDPKAVTPPKLGTTFVLKLRVFRQQTRLQLHTGLRGGCIYQPAQRRLKCWRGSHAGKTSMSTGITFAPGSRSGQQAAPVIHGTPQRAAGTATRRSPLCLCSPAADWKHPLLAPEGLKH